jgi:hypothetical protein
MLIPDTGASRVMYVATRMPAQSPVKRFRTRLFDTRSTTDMRIKAISTSATNATPAPNLPGTVTT